MAASDDRITVGHRSNAVDVAGLEVQFKKDKSRTKANFTRARNSLLNLLEEHDLPSRREIKTACSKMDSSLDIVMKVLANFSDFYVTNGEIQKGQRIANEMEKIEQDFYSTYEAAREYLDSRRDDACSVTSDTFSVDLLQRMNISDDNLETYEKETMLTVPPRAVPGVTFSNLGNNGSNSISATAKQPLCQTETPIETEFKNRNTYEQRKSDAESDSWSRILQRIQDRDTHQNIPDPGNHALGETRASTYIAPKPTCTIAATSEPMPDSCYAPSIGQDLWRQLKRVQIPVFAGDKRTYQSWKAAFIACIDSAPATGEYKLLQLRQYLTGEALKTIENLGHSTIAYEAAKERLERKYGGKRRQIALYLEELEHFRQIRAGNAKDLESFADLLDIAIINLQEAGQHYELGDGSLYTKLQRKLPESLLARYHRWVFENHIAESVLTLRSWVLQESEFQTVAAETVHGVSGSNIDTWSGQPGGRYRRTFFGSQTENQSMQSLLCPLCGARHGIWGCHEFIQKSTSERWNIAKRLQLCYRCLADGHTGKMCEKSRQCGENGCLEVHHRLLHRPESRHYSRFAANHGPISLRRNSESSTTGSPSEQQAVPGTEGKGQTRQTTMTAQDSLAADYIALRTVPVILKNGVKTLHVNALLDDASTKTYINADAAAELGLQGTYEKVSVNVLNGQVETFDTCPIDLELKSFSGDLSTKITAFTANRVTGSMCAFDWNQCVHQWPHLKHIKFPHIAQRPVVDILIGADCADLHCAKAEVRGRPGEPIARLTPLGWTCVGNPGSNRRTALQTNFASTYFVKDQCEIEKLNDNIKRFWEIDDAMVVKTGDLREAHIIKNEDKLAMKIVENSVRFDDNLYRVSIPWKEEKRALPDNYNMALRRLANTEKRLEKSPGVATAYNEILGQYIEKGYIRKVPQHEHFKSKWYLPHFPVVRPDKETSKTRIVFDASAKFDGVSLNDVIHQGPKLQRDLFDIILRFRRFSVAMVCDIAEMYLRIGLSAEDKPYHRFLWRGTNLTQSPDIYEFDRVVFGVNSSPFQAQFVLQLHAQKYQNEFPLATDTIQKSTYMDDSMDSVPCEEEGIELYTQLSQLLTKAGMHARKWLSNSPKVLAEIPVQDRKSEVDLDRERLPCAKTLGIWWLADKDIFTFKECPPDDKMMLTKRNFLRKIATLFDPIGFLAPFTIRAKILLQDMWTTGLEWDEPLTEPLMKSARAWFGELETLRRIQIPRCFGEKGKGTCSVTLHTFVDASENAYGAVVYARSIYEDDSVSSTIVAAKSRVAPNTATSIPRLELMAAIVGVRLATRIANVLELPVGSCFFWSDSLNVLWWIRGRSREFKPFVANRVAEIQTTSRPDQWRYVPTGQNPADLLSRGMRATELTDCHTWWRGPEFFLLPEDSWPVNKIFKKPPGDDEMRRHAKSRHSNPIPADPEPAVKSYYAFVALSQDVVFPLTPTNYSSWLKTKRILSWVNRFIDNCQRHRTDRTFGELLVSELKRAEIQLIRHAQCTEFREEWVALSHSRLIPSSSKLIGLQPKLDDDGLMRSDGRLKHAKFLSFDVRYPIILPRRSWITTLIIKDFHEKGNHAAGTNQTLAAVSARFWIMSGREVIREWERQCSECRRRKAKSCRQIMAPLPLSRLKTSLRAFTRTSVDYGGPFTTIQGRGKRRQKRYLCLFTCLATRAVHLEIAFGLDTDSFLNAFYRMASRRGLPEEMYSDNGTNLKAADKELKALLSALEPERIEESVSNKGVAWHFNPPLAPHFGGIHETMIKAAKKAINAILGNADITDEELMTAIVGAEALINSRPLTYQSANPADDIPLTPNHFLHGQIGGQFAPTSVDNTHFNPRKRWRRVQELVRHFWHRWLREWLPGLSGRKKWNQERRDIQAGEVVLMISPDTARGKWPLGRVTEVYPGQDGRVRVAKIQVGQGTFIRPITKLCPLECDL